MATSGESTDERADDQPLVQLVSGAVTALTLLVGFGLLAAGVPYFWIAFPVGFAGVLPMAVGAVRWYEQRDDDEASEDESDPLDELRDQYARGELTEAEFERRVEDVLESEGELSDPVGRAERQREREYE